VCKIILFCISLSPLLLTTSCDKKEKDYDKSKAVLVFFSEKKDDKSLEEITIPPQAISVDALSSSSVINQKIENFAFLSAKNSGKFLTKSKITWTGYRPSNSGRFAFSPIVFDGKIFLLDASGILTKSDLATKEKIFEARIFPRKILKNYQNPRIGIFKDKIFAITGINEIKAISIIDGKIIWSKTIFSIPISTPVADENFVYFITNDNKTYCLDTNTGAILWTSSAGIKPTTIFGSATPVIYKSEVIVGYSSGEIYALNKKNGDAKWAKNLNVSKAVSSDFYLNDIDATPVIKNDVIYAVSNAGLLAAVDANSGNYIWKKEVSSIADFWIAGAFIYLIDNENNLFAINKNDGKTKYSSSLTTTRSLPYNNVIMVGGKLLISGNSGSILVANPLNGRIEQTFEINQKIYHSPVVVDGKLYLQAVGRYSIDLIEIF
jgi:outer membrane protein assembly factor BamB